MEIQIKRRSWDKETRIEFDIYDGTSHFKSVSLQDALKKALEAHPANATMEKIEEMFGGAIPINEEAVSRSSHPCQAMKPNNLKGIS